MFYLARAIALEGNNAEAFRWYSKAADQGYTPAFFRLGLAHLDGVGTPVNPGKGISALRQASDAGSVLATRELALRYVSGKFGFRMIPIGLWLYLGVFFSAYRALARDPFAEELIG